MTTTFTYPYIYASTNNGWLSAGEAADEINGTFAVNTSPGSTEYLIGEDLGIPDYVSHGDITKVEVGLKGKFIADGEGFDPSLGIQWTVGDSFVIGEHSNSSVITLTTTNTTHWYEVTSDEPCSNETGVGWTWDKIRNFRFRTWGNTRHDLYIDQLYLKVSASGSSSSFSSSSSSESSSSISSSSTSSSSTDWSKYSEYGLLVKNKQGYTQIDGIYKNHIYREHDTVTVSAGRTKVGINTTSIIPIFAFKIPSGAYCCNNGILSNNGLFNQLLFYSNDEQDVDYIVYTEQVPTSGSYGLDIYNYEGDLVFSSNEEQYVKIIDSTNYYLSLTTDVASYQDVTVNDADNNYFVTSPVKSMYKTTQSTKKYENYTVGVKYINQTTVRVGWIKIEEGYDCGITSNSSGNAGQSYIKLIEIEPPNFI